MIWVEENGKSVKKLKKPLYEDLDRLVVRSDVDEEAPHWSNQNPPQLMFIKRGGGTVLLYSNHQFVLKKRNKSGTQCWECVNRRKKKCAGKVTLHGSDIIQEKKHTCLEDTPIQLANIMKYYL
ncbi:hypothetical protein PYW08_016042 [Mythimna loreyi]|uniref:Uncharacterized protein n=1 Tax=Mythimna loreyi TaxID=667449 RepID=A0ACC2QSD9_9NEOP|nr:hypothetical protein PYW08_016042 [Mythimna loreyi]